jgi:PTS system mannose-specific IIB component
MDIRLARIDDRLIHGQVATTWSRHSNISRILVVSDEVARSELRKFLLKQAAPPGIKSNVMTVKKLLSVSDHVMLLGVRVMLLFTNPTDVAALVKAGIEIDSVNIGGMRFTEGKKMITNFISVDEEDVEAFRYLHKKGIELEIRKVPSDRKADLVEVLKQAKLF